MGIYDAVNPTSSHRRAWKATMDEHDIQTIFIESACDDQEIIEQNVRNVKISSPDVSTPPLPKHTPPTATSYNYLMFSAFDRWQMLIEFLVRRMEPRRRHKRLHRPHQRQNPCLRTPLRNRFYLHQNDQREPTDGSPQYKGLSRLPDMLLSHEFTHSETVAVFCAGGQEHQGYVQE